MAGLSVAATVVPQGISYAQLAGLPSVFGLYGAFVPVWMYAALGSSKHLVGGEVGIVARWGVDCCAMHGATVNIHCACQALEYLSTHHRLQQVPYTHT